MDAKRTFDFWYAVNNTQVVMLPERHLETFGATVLNYHLVSELMDSTTQVRVREGRMNANRPQILTPEAYSKIMLEGFGDEASRYADWLRQHDSDIHILQYGYSIKHTAFSEHVISDNLQSVVERVKTDTKASNDPLGAVLIGVDSPWDVCLIKLFLEVVQKSAHANITELRKHGMFESENGVPRGIRKEIENTFIAAARNRALINPLAQLLKKYDLFEEYQDRFFSLVKSGS